MKTLSIFVNARDSSILVKEVTYFHRTCLWTSSIQGISVLSFNLSNCLYLVKTSHVKKYIVPNYFMYISNIQNLLWHYMEIGIKLFSSGC